MKSKSELQLIILWEKGMKVLPTLIDEIGSLGEIIAVKDKIWNTKLFTENLTRFYSHSLKHKSPEDITSIIKMKAKDCGYGQFKVIIFEDTNPKYGLRHTTGGSDQYVNCNVFDLKKKFRTQHKAAIHSSNDTAEFMGDFSLLFHNTPNKLLIKSILKNHKKDDNILGLPKWNNIEELFLALNVCTEYVVLRNFECLPNQYHVENHGDIDLLVENLNHIVHLTGAKPVFPELPYRVHYTIEIGKQHIPFDFRFINDNYYDIQWSKNILKNRVIVNDCFYTPNNENYYYSLLYHALIHKSSLMPDYVVRLYDLAQTIGINQMKEAKTEELIESLLFYLKNKDYQVVVPQDLTVYFNKHLIEKIDFTMIDKKKSLLAERTVRTKERIYSSEVYKTKNGIFKIATNPIVINEKMGLSMFEDSIHFPNIINYQELGNETSSILMEEIVGFCLTNIRNEKAFWTVQNVVKFINDSINVLALLAEKDIVHRDIRPDNIFVREVNKGSYEIVLIDFGWCCSLKSTKNVITPPSLGDIYRLSPEKFSDAYSFALSLNASGFSHFPFCKNVIDDLMSIEYESEEVQERIKALTSKITNFGLKDYIRLWFNRQYIFLNANKYYTFFNRIRRLTFWS